MDMMDIEATISTPAMRFDPSAGTLEMSGESYPENSFEFYAPLISLLKTGIGELKGLRVVIKISYMNSSSVKCMLEILDILKDNAARGMGIVIDWYYDRENSRALELAEEFREEVELPFNILPLEG